MKQFFHYVKEMGSLVMTGNVKETNFIMIHCESYFLIFMQNHFACDSLCIKNIIVNKNAQIPDIH